MKYLLAGLTLLVTVLAFRTHAAESTSPNIVLIMADDFGYECVSANGGESYQTPNLDRLAATGMRFENCHVQPLCTPTRVQLMTGLYNIRNYVRFGLLPTEETTFAQLLKAQGYATAICGKWQLGQDSHLPQHFGFDESYLWQHTRRPPRYANPGLEHNGEEKDFSNGEYGPTLVNDFALDFITRHREQPFLLYYPMILTHDPFQPTPDSSNWDPQTKGEQAAWATKHFADMTTYMDKMIGRLVAKLDELKLRENTIVIFIGDNGTLSKITSRFQGQDYQGGKGTTTCRGTHVPMIVSWPAKIKQASVEPDLISSVDFLPTLCDISGAAVPAKTDGVSFLPQLLGEQGQPRLWLYTWYTRDPKPNVAARECAFDAAYKLYRSGEFYDLSADPFEQQPLARTSLSAAQQAGETKLQAVLEQFANARPQQLGGGKKRPSPKKANKKRASKP